MAILEVLFVQSILLCRAIHIPGGVIVVCSQLSPSLFRAAAQYGAGAATPKPYPKFKPKLNCSLDT